ncbi:putative acetyltransferase, GNAT superfamily [Promicromonospora umidemergens]|uniref:GNAT superfamily acetyltransferase n=1 Tax=Promicromonospora umidemergens TaxID=629679 RepID=A0ABP8XF62_9MICO|nr:GNAT family N-acetyltransferase [Promicromonospora umidemergens]MCP2283090.1 putative acetyltransferase, GNAT superfamily [Promicromonospora umidemergens]
MSDPFTVQAARDAEAAARAAGVTVREVSGLAELAAVGDLFTTIWGKPSVSTELLRAFSKTQSYVGGAFRDGVLVGACVAFHAAPGQRSLHSHIAGVTPGTGGQGVGFALKVHQRAWALALGVDEIAWTYDPLVARNAHFNINKLAGRPAEYLTNFYGPMSDAINGGEDTDRVLVRWDLRAPAVAAACGPGGAGGAGGAGGSSKAGAAGGVVPVAVVPVPPDIESLRVADPAAAHEWRLRVRESLGPYLAGGSAATAGSGHGVGYDRERGYLIHTPTEGEHP